MEIPAGYAKCFTFWQNQCGFGTKIMQIHCKPSGLEDQDLKAEPGFGHQNHANTWSQDHANTL